MSDKTIGFPCPVCGFHLNESPWEGDLPSDSICCSCGIQFGLDDVRGESGLSRSQVYVAWRKKWVEEGMLWFSEARRPPLNWDPRKQLCDAGLLA